MNSIPEIITKNTFFWSSSYSASGRRSNEEQRQKEVYDFLKNIGFRVEREGDYVNGIGEFEGVGKVSVTFYYYESCNNVYKSFRIYRNGKKSDITLLRKIVSLRLGID